MSKEQNFRQRYTKEIVAWMEKEGLWSVDHSVAAAWERLGVAVEKLQTTRCTSTACPDVLPVPVAWRYMPSAAWRQMEITQDPERAELARENGCNPEPLYTKQQVLSLLKTHSKRGAA